MNQANDVFLAARNLGNRANDYGEGNLDLLEFYTREESSDVTRSADDSTAYPRHFYPLCPISDFYDLLYYARIPEQNHSRSSSRLQYPDNPARDSLFFFSLE